MNPIKLRVLHPRGAYMAEEILEITRDADGAPEIRLEREPGITRGPDAAIYVGGGLGTGLSPLAIVLAVESPLTTRGDDAECLRVELDRALVRIAVLEGVRNDLIAERDEVILCATCAFREAGGEG